MKRLVRNSGLGTALILAAFAIGITGCASHRQAESSQEKANASAAGAAMQQGGVMSQASYVRSRELAHQTAQTHTISETNLDWTLTELTQEKNSIGRARAFNTLAAIHPMSPTQRTKISPAIAPYLNGTNALDKLGAERVQRVLQSGN